jgi:hypothetical protein
LPLSKQLNPHTKNFGLCAIEIKLAATPVIESSFDDHGCFFARLLCLLEHGNAVNYRLGRVKPRVQPLALDGPKLTIFDRSNSVLCRNNLKGLVEQRDSLFL